MSDDKQTLFVVSARPAAKYGSSHRTVAVVLNARSSEPDDFAALGTLISWQRDPAAAYPTTGLLLVTLSSTDRDKILTEYVKAGPDSDCLTRATTVVPLRVSAFDGPVVVLPLSMLRELRGQEARAETARHGAWAFGQSKVEVLRHGSQAASRKSRDGDR